MNTRKISIGLRFLALLVTSLLLAACNNGAVKKGDMADGGVDKIAVERWNLLITGQVVKAYDYLSPGFKKTKTRDEYVAQMGNRPVHWKKVQFLGKDCEDSICHVRLLVDFTVNMNAGAAKEVSSVDVIKEDWLNQDGHWYYLPPAQGTTNPK